MTRQAGRAKDARPAADAPAVGRRGTGRLTLRNSGTFSDYNSLSVGYPQPGAPPIMRFTLFFAAAPLALAACTPSDGNAERDAGAGDTAATTAATDTAMTPPTDPMGGQAATDPQGFVNAAAASDMFEIESARLAKTMGRSAEVKEFAAMMERDHTKSTADLKTAAGTAKVTPAPEMTTRQQSDLAALRAAGDNFDRLYKQQQLAAHQQALALLRGQAEGGTAASLKAFAAKTVPVVEQHLEHVQRLP